MCYVGIYDTVGVKYLLLVPMAVYLSVGIIILFTGMFVLKLNISYAKIFVSF